MVASLHHRTRGSMLIQFFLFAARDKSQMNGNGNGKKVRATETWPDAGAMEGSALWETCIGVLASGACRRSDVGGRSVVVNVFGAVLGSFRKNFILFCNIFSTLSTVFPQMLS